MLVRTDDEVYRVDAVWLGPPRATFPWRARYVSYGVGLLVMMLIMIVQRRLGIGLDFFSVAWALVGTVAITRFLGKKIDYERPLGQVLAHFWAEVTGPRPGRKPAHGSVRAGHVRVHASSRGRPGSRGARPWKAPAREGAVAARDRGAPVTSGPFGKPVPTKGPLVGAPSGATVAPAVAGTPDAGPARVVPPLPEPGSAPRKRGPFRIARGRTRGRGATAPARISRPDPWHRGGHRGRA
ncbi:hypothetical protein H7X46_26605 [Pseudonocardia sp. C8]|uniref:hypothetical protein n=1 Tax=Pseudonocardia sp. C8 TaxID=2762759 RepID=UPI0016431866|nr:hypothetical protein [Pseudonocardia sp. C8]